VNQLVKRTTATRAITTITLPNPGPVITATLDGIPTHHRHRVLIDYFNSVLSHLIVLGDGGGTNPFQQLVIPMALQNYTVRNALYALASAHLDRDKGGGWDGHESTQFQHYAVQGLSKMLRTSTTGQASNELLAAIMLLVYYEVVSLWMPCTFIRGNLSADSMSCTAREAGLMQHGWRASQRGEGNF
jgi:hypothetical protein